MSDTTKDENGGGSGGSSSVFGTTKFGLLFRGLKSPFFGRGAAKKLTMIDPSDYKKEFWLVADGERIAKSTDRVIKASDFSDEARAKSFGKTKLPYAQSDVTPEDYINLAAYARLEVEIEDLSSEYAVGHIEQEWTQLVDSDTGLPLVRFAINLVDFPDYIPPQVRRERTYEHIEQGLQNNLQGDELEKYVKENANPGFFEHDIPKAIEEYQKRKEFERLKEENKHKMLSDADAEAERKQRAIESK